MQSELDRLIVLVFDPERAMWDYIEGRRDDLESADPHVSDQAGEEVSRMLNWLLMPRTAVDLSKSIFRAQEEIRAKMTAAGMPKYLVDAAVKRARVRDRGRPRSKNLDAIAGLRMYWLERKPWRQIVLEQNGTCKERGCKSYCPGCEDVRRKTETGRLGGTRRSAPTCAKCNFRIRPPKQKESVCYKCADRMAELVRRLEMFLAECGIRSPRQVDEQLREK